MVVLGEVYASGGVEIDAGCDPKPEASNDWPAIPAPAADRTLLITSRNPTGRSCESTTIAAGGGWNWGDCCELVLTLNDILEGPAPLEP